MKRCERIMTRDPVTCRPNEPVVSAIERMLRADVGALPVVEGEEGRLPRGDDIGMANIRMEELQVQRLPIVDDDGRLVGVLTRDDLTTRVHVED